MMPRSSPVLLLGLTLAAGCGGLGLTTGSPKDSGFSPEALPQDAEAAEPAYRESTERFVQIAAGFWETCGLRFDGSVRCWGVDGDCRDVAGECPAQKGGVPHIAKPTVGRWRQLAVGQYYTCALREEGSIDCWGEAKVIVPHIDGIFSTLSGNYAIARDSGSIVPIVSNAKEPPAGSFIVATGAAYNCGIRSDGTLACWGSARTDGVTDQPPDGTYTQLVVTNFFGCALRTDGELVCWGSGPKVWSTDPRYTPQPGGTFVQVAGHAYGLCGVRTEGTIACWGEFSGYEPPGGAYLQVAVGTSDTSPFFCALRTDGIVVCWGGNASGESSPP